MNEEKSQLKMYVFSASASTWDSINFLFTSPTLSWRSGNCRLQGSRLWQGKWWLKTEDNSKRIHQCNIKLLVHFWGERRGALCICQKSGLSSVSIYKPMIFLHGGPQKRPVFSVVADWADSKWRGHRVCNIIKLSVFSWTKDTQDIKSCKLSTSYTCKQT